LHNLKVGDKLAYSGRNGWWSIYPIESVTKTGRIKVGGSELNPDLSVRGRQGWSGGYQWQIITPELQAEIDAQQQRGKDTVVVRELRVSELTDGELHEVAELVRSILTKKQSI
jgi:hypothetical protein